MTGGRRPPGPLVAIALGAMVIAFSTDHPLVLGALAAGALILFASAPGRPSRWFLVGGAIIAAGFFIAMIVGKILSGTVSTVVRWAIIIRFTAMGLQSMGVADSIIEMAFGALVIGGAAAAVLAFGLGGRDAAARQLEKLERKATAADAPSTEA